MFFHIIMHSLCFQKPILSKLPLIINYINYKLY